MAVQTVPAKLAHQHMEHLAPGLALLKEILPFRRTPKLAIEANIPAGALNILIGGGSSRQRFGRPHGHRQGFSFTGSIPTGIAIGESAMGPD